MLCASPPLRVHVARPDFENRFPRRDGTFKMSWFLTLTLSEAKVILQIAPLVGSAAIDDGECPETPRL